MAFKFRLEPLITIRDNVLKEKQAELAKAYEARRKLEGQQTELDRQIEENAVAGRERIYAGGRVSVDDLLAYRRHEAFLLEQRAHCLRLIAMVDTEIEQRRLAVMESHRELKTVEKLKEKQKEKYDAEQAKKETVMMDEIALRKVNSD